MLSYSVRTATRADLDRLIAIHTSAFPDARGPEARRRNFEANPLGSLDDLHVVTSEGRVVAHAFLLPLGAYFGGKRVRVGGIATVGVAPEARGRGAATFLLDALHRISDERGDAITLLYPFRYAFYARLGYARVGTSRHLRIDPRSVPGSWSSEARAVEVHEATGDDLATLRALWDRYAKRFSGSLDRPSRLWERKLIDERVHWLVARRGGAPCGYVAFEHEQPEWHAATRLRVHDLVGDDEHAMRLLMGVLALQGDQCSEIDLEVAEDDPLEHALADLDGKRHGTLAVEHPFGTIAGGPMVRLARVERALTSRGWPVDGEIALTVDGQRVRVIARAGHATVEPGTERGLALDSQTLAAIAFGSLRPCAAVALGLADGTRDDMLRADALLPLGAFFSRDSF